MIIYVPYAPISISHGTGQCWKLPATQRVSKCFKTRFIKANDLLLSCSNGLLLQLTILFIKPFPISLK